MNPTTNKNASLTLGSLFDGTGGFPLAGQHAGFDPVWASEIEPAPIRVTHTRIPDMKHLGDITTIDGAKIPAVDVVTFGSPCTDLSVAGSRQGLAGKSSSLFFQAVRVISEMRKATNGAYPKYCVWENVPGAFASNKGADFHTVLTSLIGLTGEPAVLPMPTRWPHAGWIQSKGASIAWRVLDAQYFGVPQRRKRIYLALDFTSPCAGQILFEPHSGHRDPYQGSKEKQNPTQGPKRRTPNSSLNQLESARVFSLNTMRDDGVRRECAFETKVAKTLDCSSGQVCNQGATLVVEPVYGVDWNSYQCSSTSTYGALVSENIQPTLIARGAGAVCEGRRVRKLTPLECARLQGFPDTWTSQLENPNPSRDELEFWVGVWDTWNQIRGVKPKTEKQIRTWLATPLKDAALYKMWGNGIALPCAQFVLENIAKNIRK